MGKGWVGVCRSMHLVSGLVGRDGCMGLINAMPHSLAIVDLDRLHQPRKGLAIRMYIVYIPVPPPYLPAR